MCASLYVIRNDVLLLYTRTVEYVTSKMNVHSTSQGNDIVVATTNTVTKFVQSIHTPGALRAQSDTVARANLTKLDASDVIILTNKERIATGNTPLTENPKLSQSAQIKLNDIFDKQYFEHASPSGVQVKDLAGIVSYDFITIGENLAFGNFKSDQTLVHAWMASSGHRANILNKYYTEIGVAVGHRAFNGVDTWIAVQHFGLPRSACPSTDEVLHGIILLNEKEITALEADLVVQKNKINSGGLYEGKTTEEQVTEYNTLVQKHNRLAQELQQKVAQYNAGVRASNACIEANSETKIQ